ncbi:GTP 3',8-cyclase MoaA [archaeon SCG-AAA382B04]|nr:GTP 3',8-cyclase MoaA [archaeon SCG-AAA382B04]
MDELPRDKYGRPITNIRFSLTQQCNLDCIYCHNEGETNSEQEIEEEKVEKIVNVARKRNIRKVKLTGGEPLLRDDLIDIIDSISPHLDDTSITTNGTLLKNKVDSLVKAGLDRTNISLDSLDPEKYEKLTNGGNLEDALDGIKSAISSPLYPIKINTVILDSINVNELDDFIDFAKENDIILQLIEFHDTNTLKNGSELFKKYHHDLSNLEKQLSEKAEKIETRRMHNRKKYFFDGAEVEIVKPMHNTEFCANCTRLRVTSDGKFKPCLMRNDNYVETEDKEIEEAFDEAIMRREPYFD